MAKTLTIKTKLDTKDFTQQISALESELNDLERAYSGTMSSGLLGEEKRKQDLEEIALKIEKVKNKLVDLKSKQDDATGKNAIDFKGIISGMSKVIKSVGKWGLAVFAVRSAYSAIRSAISTCSQYNEQLSTDLEYMRYAIAQAIMPVVQVIVKLIYQILQGINYVTKSLFNYDLFLNSSVDSFKKANSEAKKLKNTLASYDTANILSDTSSSSTSSEYTPSFNLSEADEEVETFLDKIAKGWEGVGNDMQLSLKDIGAYFDTFGEWGLAIWGVVDTFYGLWEVADGVIKMIVGLFQMLIGSIAGDNDLLKKGISNTWNGIKETIKGVIETIKGLLATVVGVIWGLFVELLKGLWGMIRWLLDSIIDGINILIRGMNSLQWDVPSWVPVIGGQKWGINIPEVPRLKTGAIINMPGTGVPIASAGEAGREGIIPLTDERAMAQLGEEIGKHISINVDMVNKIDSRVLSKQLYKVKTDNSFARNGG